MRKHSWDRLLWAALFLSISGSLAAAQRSLFWRSLEVQALLDAHGSLHVLERQAMVFTGDWNGGERIFRLRPGQTLSDVTLARIGPDAVAHELSSGDLSEVDQYAWTDEHTLRWRSRLPSDPAFEHTQIVYELRYSLSGILARSANRYVLDHDFAFPDRSGAIEKFSLGLKFDPAWNPDSPIVLTRGPLAPGQSVVVERDLAYTGSGHPVTGRPVAGRTLRLRLLLLLLLAMAVLAFLWVLREKRIGRFSPIPDPARIDEAWLDQNLFGLLPEQAGALWDETIGAPEVAAILARLASEKKIQTEVHDKTMTMRLAVPRERFSGYEGALIDGLFFDGRTETDTDAIRGHYRAQGFDPSSKIKPGLEKTLATLPDFQDKSARRGRWIGPLLFLAAAASLVLAVKTGQDTPARVVPVGIVHLVFWIVAAVCAGIYQKRVDGLGRYAPLILWPPAALLWLSWTGYRDAPPDSPLLAIGFFLIRLTILWSVFSLARTPDGPRRMARRKMLVAARRYFARELSRPAPRLKDAWFPYVIAFELSSRADKWFRAFAGTAAAGTASLAALGASGRGSASSGEASGSWTGGGGSFGGAGATVGWAAAAGTVAAGVSAPSSSGGGGGGGGGSSGGGGGGGW